MESRKERVFKFGIYGAEVGSIDEEELNAMIDEEYVEILSPEDMQLFRDDLNSTQRIPKTARTKPVPTPVPADYRLRMKIEEWKRFLFGPIQVISSRLYFGIIDWLLKHDGCGSTAEIRAELGTDPKTMHYICMKLKSFNLVVEEKDANSTVIKLLPLIDRSSTHPKDRSVEFFNNLPSMLCKNHKIFNFVNLDLIDQIKYHINKAKQGITSRMLSELMGLRTKVSLRMLQLVCEKEPDEFCVASMTARRSKVFVFYNRKKYEEERINRLERIVQGNSIPAKREITYTISDEEKIAAITSLAKKYKSFVLDKEVYREMAEITGWAYSFDKKTIIRTALAAGLRVVRLNSEHSSQTYLIELEDEAESCEISEAINQDEIEIKEKEDKEIINCEIAKKIGATYLKSSVFVPHDNGYRINRWDGNKQLLLFLREQYVASEPIILSDNKLYEMELWLVFYLFRFCQCKFRDNLIAELRNKSINKEKEFEKMKISEVMEILKYGTQKMINKTIKWEKLAKMLKELHGAGYINYLHERGEVVILNKEPDEELDRLIAECKPASYVKRSVREEFVRIILKEPRNKMYEKAVEITERMEDKMAARILLERAEILKLEEAKSITRRREESEVSVTCGVVKTEQYKEAYFKIKNGIFMGQVTAEIFNKDEPNITKQVMESLLDKKVISGYTLSGMLPSISLSAKFKKKFSWDIPFIREKTGWEISDESNLENLVGGPFQYFGLYFPLIYKFVERAKSVDIGKITEQVHSLEDFELMKFFEVFSERFSVENIRGFYSVTLSSEKDPFQLS